MTDQLKLKLLLLFVILLLGGLMLLSIAMGRVASSATSAFGLGWTCAVLLTVTGERKP
jgi:hypothetical protein